METENVDYFQIQGNLSLEGKKLTSRITKQVEKVEKMFRLKKKIVKKTEGERGNKM
jgi:hypothetical protein